MIIGLLLKLSSNSNINKRLLINETIKFVVAGVIASILLIRTINFFEIRGILILLLLTTLLYVCFTSMAGSEMALSLPFSTYPPPPHLGSVGLR